MKFFAVFAAVLAAAAAYPAVSTWSLPELSAALQDPNTDPAIMPYLENALNEVMASIHAGKPVTSAVVSIPIATTWTLDEVMSAMHDPATNPALLPYLQEALHELMVAINNGQEEPEIQVNIPAMEVNVWTLQQLSYALQNPETDPELVVYLEHALDQLMEALFNGQSVASIPVVTPPGVHAVVPDIENPQPIVMPEPVIFPPGPIKPPKPVIKPPTSVITPPAPVAPATSSPLVQLIINVNTQGQATPATVTTVPMGPWAVHPAVDLIDNSKPAVAVFPW